MEHLQYPIGPYIPPDSLSSAQRKELVNELATFPTRLHEALSAMTDQQLDTPYRPGGWTVRQLVHHIADSHMNAFCRIRLALTEENPTINPYDQEKWASLEDAKVLPVDISLEIVRGVHARWSYLMDNLNSSDLQRTFSHPELQKSFSVDEMTGFYVHHGNNHLAQINGLKARKGW